MTQDHPFELGGRYRNSLGEYEVLAIESDRMTVRFDDGRTQTLDLATQERIWRRQQEDQERATAPPPSGVSKSKAASATSTRRPSPGTQYWLKPQGASGEPVDLNERCTDERYLTGFSRRPAGVSVGDVLIMYRTGIAAVQYAAEAMAECREATLAEIEREPWRHHWGWVIEARNLTPEFGAEWGQRDLKIRSIVDDYNTRHPDHPISLGALNYGADKLRIPEELALDILRRMRDPH